MRQAGDIVLTRFPQANLAEGKLRPALLLGRLPGDYDDWLICMISSQARHYQPDFDELVSESDSDFADSGLKTTASFGWRGLQLLKPVFCLVMSVIFLQNG